MSTDLAINTLHEAWRATHRIDDLITQARLSIYDQALNLHGIYRHPSYVKECNERAIRLLMEANKAIDETHWPSEAEYREV